MNKFKTMCLAVAMAASTATTFAGGLLTNTNQNAAFLRNAARDAVIDIDGVYSNPAGIAFMPQGWHISLSWQAAMQKRQLDVNNPLFAMNTNNPNAKRSFEGDASAPVIPSVQAAWVINDKWSVSGQFAVGGGGGKCEFDNGLPMFEELIAGMTYMKYQELITAKPEMAGVISPSYSMNQNLTGEQYIYGLQLGGTYKVLDNLAVFAGARGVYFKGAYVGEINNIKVLGQDVPGYSLDCQQKGFGITPIIGVDWNLGRLNLAAKYEFRTNIVLENDATNSPNLAALASTVPAVAVFADGANVDSDIPAILTVGAQYQLLEDLRVMGGFHYYFDKDCEGASTAVSDNTWEALLGVEWDVNDKIMLSLGAQRTQYGFDDEDMGDTNFNISSTALTIGGAYKFNEKMKLNVGYMHSFYGNHEFTNANKTACDYTRKNDVFGVSLDYTF